MLCGELNHPAGRPYTRDEGVEHNVVNACPHEFVFLEIEMKKGDVVR